MTPHLSDTTLEQLALGELDTAARAAAVRHATSCPACAALVRGVLAVEAGARAARLDGGPAAPRGGRPRWIWAAAAVVAAVAVLLVIVRRDDQARPPVRRGAGVPTITVIAPRDPARPPIELAWHPVDGATGYRVQVFAGDGRPLWIRPSTSTRLPWPADVPLPAVALRWRVEALDDSGVIAASALVPLRVEP